MAASISLLFLTVQAVPTLLSCLAFSSFSPLFLVSSFPFSSLFVTLSLCISVASWCASPFDGAFTVDEKPTHTVCHLSIVSSKLRPRSWWCCRQAPRGFPLAMLFLTWSLLLLLLCMPCLARAGTDGAHSHVHQRVAQISDCDPLAYGVEDDPACDETTSEVLLKGSTQAEAAYNSGGGGASKQEEGPVVPVIAFKKQKTIKLQSSLDSSVQIVSSGFAPLGNAHNSATAGRGTDENLVEISDHILCRALVRAGGGVICSSSFSAQPASSQVPADVLLDLGYISTETLSLKSSPASAPDVAIVPSQLQWGQQPLFRPLIAPLTIINTCNSSRLTVHTPVSDNWQFYVSGFRESVVAPGGILTLPVVYLPQSVGTAEGILAVETSAGRLLVQTQGEGIGPPYKLQLKTNVGEKLQHVISLFNPFDETITVEEVFAWPEGSAGFTKDVVTEPSIGTMGATDSSSGSNVDEKLELGTDEESSNQGGLQMRAAGPWEIEPQSSQDVVEFDLLSKEEEKYEGSVHIRISGVSSGNGEDTLVFPVSVQVAQLSPVRAVPDILDFGMLVGGDQASTQPLILLNSGDQLVQIEEIYEVSGDSKVSIDYKRGCALAPGIETEVAKITYSGLEEKVLSVPCDSSPCGGGQKIVVRTNSTRTLPIEVPYRALVLQGLECPKSPPSMGFVTESTGRAAGDLILGESTDETPAGQGMDKRNFLPAGFRKIQLIAELSSQILDGRPLTENGRLFFGLLFFALLLGVVVFFRMFVQDTVLPTLSGEPVKGGSHRKSSGRMSALLGTGQIRNRDRFSKMRGLGALAAVADGLAAALGSALGRNDCSMSSSQLNLPHIRVKVSNSSAVALPQTTKPNGGGGGASTKEAGLGALHVGGRKGSSDRKQNGASRPDHPRNAKAALETPDECLPVSISEPPPASGKLLKTSKSPKAKAAPVRPPIFIEASNDGDCPQSHGVKAPPPAPDLAPGSPIREPAKTGTTPFKNALAQKVQPVSPRSQNTEREKNKRKKKKGHGGAPKHDLGSHLGACGGASPASPASPGTPASLSRPVSPLTSDLHSTRSTSSLTDQAPLSSSLLSPKSLGAGERVASAAPLAKLDVHSLKESNPAPAFVRPESLSVDVASTVLRQMAQANVADLSWRASAKREPGTGKRGINSNEWVAVARKNPPNSAFARGDDIEDGGQPYRGGGRAHRAGNVHGLPGTGAAPALTPSATFPRRNARGAGWNAPAIKGTKSNPVDAAAASTVPPPAIAPSLRAPGARIVKQSSIEAAPVSDTVTTGWRSRGFTANPELRTVIAQEKDLGSGSPRHSGDSLSGQSSGELVYDIWGNHFGNLSHCSSQKLQQEAFGTGLDKECDPVSGFHRLLVPDHSESLFAGSAFAGDMSPTAQAFFASFSGFFSEVSPLGPADHSHPVVNELAGHPYVPPGLGGSDRASAVVPKLGVIGQVTAGIGTSVATVKPRVRVPYSPPMGCASTSAFSPLSTPTAANSSSPRTADDSFCSFWSTGGGGSSNLHERVPSPVPSLT